MRDIVAAYFDADLSGTSREGQNTQPFSTRSRRSVALLAYTEAPDEPENYAIASCETHIPLRAEIISVVVKTERTA